MIIAVLLIAAFVACVGGMLFLSNPKRFTNQVFALLSAGLTAELLVIHKAMEAGIRFAEDGISNPLIWLRSSAALKVFFPWLFWLLFEATVHSNQSKWHSIRKSAPWFALSAGLALVTMSDWYIPADSSPNNVRQGSAYVIVGVISVAACAYIIIRASLQLRFLLGIRRIELQFLVINSAATAFLVIPLFAIGNILRAPIFAQLSMFFVLSAAISTAWAVTYHRIFDVHQVLLPLLQKALLSLLIIGGFFGLWRLRELTSLSSVDLLTGLGVYSVFLLWFDRKSEGWFDSKETRRKDELRREVIELARTEPEAELLTARFEAMLREICRTNRAALLFQQDDAYESPQLTLSRQGSWHPALCQLGWASPESLQRRRPSPVFNDLREFLTQHSLGLILAVPRGSPAPALLLALGTKNNEAPFTYPEVERLQNIAELMDNILIRSRFNAQAVLQARMEHLAMMSRGLAHDLKNLVTPVSTFLVHTDGQYPAGSAEEEVHASARRAMRVMTEYLREAMFFAERLEPRRDHVDLRQLLTSVQGIADTRAAHRSVTIEISAPEAGAMIADTALLQRLLANLVCNAIDASVAGQKVSLRANPVPPDQMRFEVSDHGCGIAPENLGRIFEPYFTTKIFGDDVRGFGLGLSISQRIVELHNGRIEIQSELHKGTTVIVTLPVNHRDSTTPRSRSAQDTATP